MVSFLKRSDRIFLGLRRSLGRDGTRCWNRNRRDLALSHLEIRPSQKCVFSIDADAIQERQKLLTGSSSSSSSYTRHEKQTFRQARVHVLYTCSFLMYTAAPSSRERCSTLYSTHADSIDRIDERERATFTATTKLISTYNKRNRNPIRAGTRKGRACTSYSGEFALRVQTKPLSLKARLFNNTQFLICRVMYHFTNPYTNCSLLNYALKLKLFSKNN
ncbi:unnamed protein product [Trichogramma brassicae]|uniref:Uncharacterized protein n=1 Tax=Trichogramma brassicae TaxID=86971 RepID=A0A6H5I9G5_9HYME|nr:unnamed protein product [Trichogramma brassicae]